MDCNGIGGEIPLPIPPKYILKGITFMHYEINVSLDGYHLFGTHKRSLQTEAEANRLYALFCKKFPATEGYEITLNRYECKGTTVAQNVRANKK